MYGMCGIHILFSEETQWADERIAHQAQKTAKAIFLHCKAYSTTLMLIVSV